MAIPIFDKNIKTLREFDSKLADHLASMRGIKKFRRLFYSGIDGSATRATSDPTDIRLVGKFLGGCRSLNTKDTEVHWICTRGAARGFGNLFSLRESQYHIELTGCDGNEAIVNGSFTPLKPEVDFSGYFTRLDKLRQRHSLPVTYSVMGHSVLCVFIGQQHPGYDEFKETMGEIAQSLQQETGVEYRVKIHQRGIMLERADKIGKDKAISRIRQQKEQEIGLEIYGGDDESDIAAQQMVYSEPHGFAYKIFSTREKLETAAASGPGNISGFIDGPEQWARLIAMIAAAL